MKPESFLVATDAVIFSTNAEKQVLLIQRKNEPFKNCWALPGGFLERDEDLEVCALRELREETSVAVKSMKQVGAYGHPLRDPRGRVISVAFTAEVQHESITLKAADDAKKVAWHPLKNLPALAFDHAQIIADAGKLMGF